MFQENIKKTFNYSIKRQVSLKKKYTAHREVCCDSFPSGIYTVLQSFMVLMPAYKPNCICPGGGNVALKSRN